MAAQKGRDYLLQIGDGGSPATYSTIGGGKSFSLTIGNTIVDVSNQDSAGIRELLADAGITSFTFTMSGTFIDDTAVGTLHTQARDRTHTDYKITVPGLGAFEGIFGVSNLSWDADFGDSVQYSVTLESAAPVTFTSS